MTQNDDTLWWKKSMKQSDHIKWWKNDKTVMKIDYIKWWHKVMTQSDDTKWRPKVIKSDLSNKL